MFRKRCFGLWIKLSPKTKTNEEHVIILLFLMLSPGGALHFFQKSSLTRCFSKCNACIAMRSTHLYVTMVTHTTCVWSGGFVQPMYIHGLRTYSSQNISRRDGRPANFQSSRKGAVWWWCKQGRSTTTVFVGWSVLAQSTQPSNHHLESTTRVPSLYVARMKHVLKPPPGESNGNGRKKTCSSWFIISFSFQWRLGPKTVPTSVWNSLHGKSLRNY